MFKRLLLTTALLISLTVLVTACGSAASQTADSPASSDTVIRTSRDTSDEGTSSPDTKKEATMVLYINNQKIKVRWEDNASVKALKDLVSKAPLTIRMSMYGGFEQVGSIGQDLPRSDKNITTSSGDIVLYSGDQMVIFYGSNSWAYTRLGHIEGLNDKELEELLSGGGVTVGIKME